MLRFSQCVRCWPASISQRFLVAALLGLLPMAGQIAAGADREADGVVGVLEALRPKLGRFSRDLKEFVQAEASGAPRVALGEIRGRIAPDINRSAGLQYLLREELDRCNLAVAADAPFRIQGEYRFVVQQDRVEIGFLVRLQVVDTAGDRVKFQQDLTLEDRDAGMESRRWIAFVDYMKGLDSAPAAPMAPMAAAPAAPTHVVTAPRPLPKSRATPISAPMPAPAAPPPAPSPYRMRILVKVGDQYQDREFMRDRFGRAQVDLRSKEEFAVELTNQRDVDAAAELTIDGLNVFVFSENREYRYFIIPAHQTLLVRGWHRSNQESDAFCVTSYSRSAAAQFLMPPGAVGLITARFAAAWEDEAARPADERLDKGEDIAIGRGGRIPSAFEPVQRYVGKNWTILNVRYRQPPAAPVSDPQKKPSVALRG